MTDSKIFDVIIIGGSYAGLSAGMSLGRALRNVLIIDSGKPCNIQTSHSHNFLTHDGNTPKEIATLAKRQVQKYKTVKFYNGLATRGIKRNGTFEIATQSGDSFVAKKLIFATGINDIMPDIKGFAECWGISIIHCPYCHGYEYSNDETGILANGDAAFEVGKLIHNWTKQLTVFTNGKSTMTKKQSNLLNTHNINIVETEIDHFKHNKGQIETVVFKDKTSKILKALYATPEFEQNCKIPEQLGCTLTEHKYLEIDSSQKTPEDGIFACGDNTSMMRSVSYAVAMGGMAGAVANKELIEDEF